MDFGFFLTSLGLGFAAGVLAVLFFLKFQGVP